MKPRQLGILTVLLVAGCSRPVQSEPLLLGFLPTGGEPSRRGVQLATREANEQEELIAGRRVAFVTPSIPDEKQSVQALAARLVAVNRVPALIGGSDADEADAIGRAAQPDAVDRNRPGAFVVALCVLPASQLADHVFPPQLAFADQGTLLARFAAEELAADAAAVVATTDPAHSELASAFVRQFTKDDSARRVERHSFDEKTDRAALAEAVRKTSPKAVLVTGTAADFAAVREAFRKAKVWAPLLFGGTAADRLELENDREASQGVYVATLYGPDSDLQYRQFAANYQKEFGQEPDAAARLAHDAANVLFGAFRRSRSVNRDNRDKQREELAKAFVVKLGPGKLGEAKSYKLPGK